MGTNYPVRLIFGLEPDRLTGTELRFNLGSVAEARGSEIYNLTNQHTINLNKNGLWGFDNGKPKDGDSIQFYVIANDDAKEWGIIATDKISYRDIVYPEGFVFKRKMRIAFPFHQHFGGIPTYHISHWPHPEVRFTDSEYDSKWRALDDGISSDWKTISLKKWLPDAARMAIIQTRVQYVAKSGSAYIRSYEGQTTGRLIGSVGSSAPWAEGERKIRVQSDHDLQYRCDPGVKLSIYVLGYCMTGPA